MLSPHPAVSRNCQSSTSRDNDAYDKHHSSGRARLNACDGAVISIPRAAHAVQLIDPDDFCIQNTPSSVTKELIGMGV